MATRLTDEERAQAIDLYRTGLTLAQVGVRMNRSPYTVHRVLVGAGIPRRRNNQPTITDAERAKVVRLYAEGLSTYDVAVRVDRSQAAVWKILAAAGVPRRPAGWPKGAATRRRDRAGAR